MSFAKFLTITTLIVTFGPGVAKAGCPATPVQVPVQCCGKNRNVTELQGCNGSTCPNYTDGGTLNCCGDFILVATPGCISGQAPVEATAAPKGTGVAACVGDIDHVIGPGNGPAPMREVPPYSK